MSWAAVAGLSRYDLTIPGRLDILLRCQLFDSSTRRAANLDVVNSADTAIEATQIGRSHTGGGGQ